MDFDKKEFSTYLDGVPFSIGKKFCPPHSVALPDDAIRYEVPQELLFEKYEFTMESKVLADIKEKKEKAEEEERNKRAVKLKQQADTSSVSNGTASSSHPVKALLWPAASILQPKSKSPSKIVSLNRSESVKKINLSDFENDSSSPFDYVELQTINDMEELNTVFQGMCKNEKELVVSADDENTSAPSSENLGNVSKSISFPLSEAFNLTKSAANSQSETSASVSSTSFVSKSFTKNSENYLSYSYPNMPGACREQSGTLGPSEKVKRNSFASDTVGLADVALSQVPYAPSIHDQNRRFSSQKGVISDYPSIPLRSSKSIPDLTNLLPNDEAVPKVERSHTPPATRARSMTRSPRNDELTYVKVPYFVDAVKPNSWSSNGPLTCPTVQPEQQTTKQDGDSSLQDPYNELSNSERRIVDFITDMGFLRGQVSRTVKHLGTDEKKVVEHLCQIQALEESGYDKLEAETALHLHDYDKNEAIRYLDLLNQFQDLGFQKDAIRKALVQNKNDRDKVIDALLS